MVRVASHFQTLKIRLQSFITRAFSIDIAHVTKFPNIQFGLNVLKGDGTSFGYMIK